MYVFGRFRFVRSFMVWRYSHKVAKVSSTEDASLVETQASSLASTVDVDAVVREIQRDGVCTGLNLRPEILEQLHSYSLVATCYGDGKNENAFHYGNDEGVTGSFRLGRYINALGACPTLQNLARDPQLLAIARKYLHTEPVLLCARMWWSLAGPADTWQQKAAGQGFHYDIDGYRGLTFFFYLTNVGPSNGPHVYVRGTHNQKSLKHLVSLHKAQSDEEIASRYGAEKQVCLYGSAGSGFAEDIFGYHKGMHPDQDRLIVQVRYGLRDYGTGHAD